jgi:hypothetical protein
MSVKYLLTTIAVIAATSATAQNPEDGYVADADALQAEQTLVDELLARVDAETVRRRGWQQRQAFLELVVLAQQPLDVIVWTLMSEPHWQDYMRDGFAATCNASPDAIPNSTQRLNQAATIARKHPVK